MPSTKRPRSPTPPASSAGMKSAGMKSAPASVLGSPGDPWSYHKETVPADVPLRLLPQLVQLADSEDPADQLQGALLIRKLLCVADNPPIGPVVASHVVPRLISFMPRDDSVDLQLEATWAVTKVACGPWAHTADVLEHGAVRQFMRLLNSPVGAVREKASWALVTMVGDCDGRTAYRDFVLGQGAVAPLLQCITTAAQNLSVTRNAVRALRTLCGANPGPGYSTLREIVPVIVPLLTHDDEAVAADACWGLTHFTAGCWRIVLDADALPHIVSLLTSRNASLQAAAARNVGNIAASSVWDDTGAEQVQLLVSSGALLPFHSLLQHPEWEVRMEACRSLFKVTVGSAPERIRAVIDAELFPAIVQCIDAAEVGVKVEAVECVDGLARGTPEQIRYAVEELDVFKHLVPVLAVDDSKLLKVALDAVATLLKAGHDEKQRRGLATNPFVQHVTDNGGVSHLETLLGSHTDEDVRDATLHIIRRFLADVIPAPLPQFTAAVKRPADLMSRARNFDRTPSSCAAVEYSVPHDVISQILRPDMAAFMAHDRAVVRTHHDERCCVDKVTFIASGSPVSADIEYLELFPHLAWLDLGAADDYIDAELLGLVAKLTQLRHLSLWRVSVSGVAAVGHLARLEHLDLSECRLVNAAGLVSVGKLTQLQHLNLSGCDGVDAVGLASVGKLTSLKHLNLGRCGGVDAAGLASLETLTQLQHLDFSKCHRVNAAGLVSVGKLTRLKHLDLHYCDGVVAAGLASVGKLTKLEHLDISGCKGVTAAGLASVGTLTSLKHLNLFHCGGVDAAGLALLETLTQLQHLEISGCDNAGLASVGKLTQLQHLGLRCRGGVDAAGLALLETLTQLQHLVISGCNNAGLASVGKLTQLQHLGLSGCGGADAASLALLETLTQLQHLDLSKCHRVNAAGLVSVGKLTSLKHLDLHHCGGVDAAGLASVGKLTKLEHLDISGCDGVSAAGLASVGKLTQLQHLDLSACDGVTAAGLASVGRLTQLQCLKLSGCDVNAVGLASVGKLTCLRHLDLSECRGVDIAGLASVGNLAQLQRLRLRKCCGVPAEGLMWVGNLTQLQYLDLIEFYDVDAAVLVAVVGRLTQLKHLEVTESACVEELRQLCPKVTDCAL